MHTIEKQKKLNNKRTMMTHQFEGNNKIWLQKTYIDYSDEKKGKHTKQQESK